MQEVTKRGARNRLRTIQGHLRGVERMIEEDAYCIDVIKQLQAVQRAIEKVEQTVLANHLRTCVSDAIRSADESRREHVITEVLDVLEAAGRASRVVERQPDAEQV